jgi:hypothetical protein
MVEETKKKVEERSSKTILKSLREELNKQMDDILKIDIKDEKTYKEDNKQ